MRVAGSVAVLAAVILPVGRAQVTLAQAGDRCESKRAPQHTRCTGCPPTYDGKLCASTTRYNDQTKGACGCGDTDPVPTDSWTLTKMTAALNCKNLDVDHPKLAWCPSGCGGCYRLCTTGGTTQGLPTKPGICRNFKITNRCGDGFDVKGGRDWCSQHMSWKECQEDPTRCKEEGNTNWFGYSAHFDLQDFHHQVSGALDWDNVEVTFEVVPCRGNWTGPSWDCKCSATQDATPRSSSPQTAALAGASGSSPSATVAPNGVLVGGTLPGAPAVPAPGGSVVPTLPPPPKGPASTLPSVPQAQAPAMQPPPLCAGAFEQCGGEDWNGPTCCEPGCQCAGTKLLFWQQCVPALGAKTCGGRPQKLPAWAFIRKDARPASITDEANLEGQQTVATGGLLLAASAAVALTLGGLVAFGAALLRQRWYEGQQPRRGQLRRGWPLPRAGAGHAAAPAVPGRAGRVPLEAPSPALPPALRRLSADHLAEAMSPVPMLPLSC